ncbi:MAG TPA: molybdopterin cofactor-binding domain-containing protein, partial [Dehalococcoidia bacterium]|nr:molybdopterin cofactor-binding domain-containing protein [Dehalococcoidia bacterium]
MVQEFTIIGKPLPRVEGFGKITGQAKYTDDLVLPRMLYGKFLTSVYPHARIVDIDLSQARSLPGVHAILTGKDLPIRYSVSPLNEDETALAMAKVRYVGQPVAVVAAVDEETAERAIGLIRVEYEPLAAVMSVEEALRPEAPLVHSAGNIHQAHSLEYGDVEEGFRQVDYVREDIFFYQGSNHLALEQHVALAQYDPTSGKVTVWTSTQSTNTVHRILSKVLELPGHQVRIIAPTVGGGFGGKFEAFPHEICAAKLAIVTGRPVKITLTREEVFYAHRGRAPTHHWIRTGVKRDGTITATHVRAILDGGAHSGIGLVGTANASG